MIVWETIAVAFAMFSAIPVPQPVWNEKNMRYMLCAFPLIGGIIGAACALWIWFVGWLGVTDLVRGAGLCVIPILITGGIHLDGYADTSDALSSYGSREKKLAILSDPHCGAFAVIRLAVYLLAYLALCVQLRPDRTAVLALGLSFVLSRLLSGFAVARFAMAKDTGLAHTFASSSDKRRVGWILGVCAVLAAAVLVAVARKAGVCMVCAAVIVLCRYRTVARKHFGGITGDLAGWFLQKAELWMLAMLVICQLLEGKG